MLNAMSAGRVYGYDIVRRLRDIEGLVISEGTIYPILSRFRREALVRSSIAESPQGPARKYYQLTDRGRRMLSRMNTAWAMIQAGVNSLKQEQ